MWGSDRRHEAPIAAGYRHARALARDPDGARDLVHDAWLSLLARHGIAPERPLPFRAIRHRHVHEYRRVRRAGRVDFDDAGGEPGSDEMLDARLRARYARLRCGRPP